MVSLSALTEQATQVNFPLKWYGHRFLENSKCIDRLFDVMARLFVFLDKSKCGRRIRNFLKKRTLTRKAPSAAATSSNIISYFGVF